MKLKTGKEEISCLLTIVFEKYETETGNLIVRNTNRKNYESVAKKLSEISNELPITANNLQHDPYSSDQNLTGLEYPSRKYDITASQVKDGSLGLVNNPRSFLIDACYIYLFGMGRKGFEKNPQDDRLLIREGENTVQTETNNPQALALQIQAFKDEKQNLQKAADIKLSKAKTGLLIGLAFLSAAFIFSTYHWITNKNEWEAVKKDMNILPYKPTKAEIDSLEGIWLCYTGSPQARSSEPKRYHLVVLNIVEIKYRNGYFSYNRYGAGFNHTGFAQFESPGLVSLHSRIKNQSVAIESPRHSLMQLDHVSGFLPVISASWNFDVGDKNKIIGIREVYKKLSKDGSIEEVINTIENASCKCKILKLFKDGKYVQTFQLKHQLLDSMHEPMLEKLLNEKSILLREPQDALVLMNDSLAMQK